MTFISFPRTTRLAVLPALLLCGTGTAAASPFNPAPGAPVRIERINGSNAMTVAEPKATVGLRVARFRVPAGVTTAEIRVTRDGKVVQRRIAKLALAGDGTATLKRPVKTDAVGTYRVGVRVAGRLVGEVVEFDALPRRVAPGASGRSTRMMQTVLTRRKYVVGAPGQFDGRTTRALVAVRKRLGLSRTGTYNGGLARRLARGEGAWKVRFPGHGRHIEANLSWQLLALIGDGGKVERIYPTSSGKPSTPTVRGNFAVYRKDLGMNAKGMVNSSYFIRGYAIHGYHEVPTYNASHGCLRVPVPDSMNIFRWVRYGTKVDVYA